MFIDPMQLIDETIDHLQTLAAHFEDETSDEVSRTKSLSPDARRCKEALLTITVLIPKLRAARIARLLGTEPPRGIPFGQECGERRDAQERLQLNARQHRMCLHCED